MAGAAITRIGVKTVAGLMPVQIVLVPHGVAAGIALRTGVATARAQ